MGKSLNGKELGLGISQRKDGKYIARFTDKNKKRIVKYFNTFSECNEWLVDAKYNDLHACNTGMQITVDEWFKYWIVNIKEKTVRINTIRNYTDRYNCTIKNCIGDMLISDVKPMHCQMVLNEMEKKNYAGSTMEQTRITMFNMFDCAKENEIIQSNPVKRSVKCPKKSEKKNRVLTIQEQKAFLDSAEGTSNYCQYRLVLHTGVRAGELIGLKWEDIDFENREIHIRRSVGYNFSNRSYIIGEPKSESGYRVIPMTQVVYEILVKKKQDALNRKLLKEPDNEFKDFIFLNRDGVPTKNSTYDAHIRKIAKKAGIESFSMHTLRHTFATRCIEAGMRPKTLQKILGHSNINITMNLYVHVTEDEKKKEMKKFEEMSGIEF